VSLEDTPIFVLSRKQGEPAEENRSAAPVPWPPRRGPVQHPVTAGVTRSHRRPPVLPALRTVVSRFLIARVAGWPGARSPAGAAGRELHGPAGAALCQVGQRSAAPGGRRPFTSSTGCPRARHPSGRAAANLSATRLLGATGRATAVLRGRPPCVPGRAGEKSARTLDPVRLPGRSEALPDARQPLLGAFALAGMPSGSRTPTGTAGSGYPEERPSRRERERACWRCVCPRAAGCGHHGATTADTPVRRGFQGVERAGQKTRRASLLLGVRPRRCLEQLAHQCHELFIAHRGPVHMLIHVDAVPRLQDQ